VTHLFLGVGGHKGGPQGGPKGGQKGGSEADIFKDRVFSLLVRYNSLQGGGVHGGGFQAAIPNLVFDALLEYFDVSDSDRRFPSIAFIKRVATYTVRCTAPCVELTVCICVRVRVHVCGWVCVVRSASSALRAR
jgi:hypothetical protein